MRIVLVGYGKMGAALLSQWLAGRPEGDVDTFVVVDPGLVAAAPKPDGARFLTDLPTDEPAFDLIIMAVKPQAMDHVLPLYARRLAADGFVASIAAGRSLARLKTLADGAPVVRIMPNLPAAIGQGFSGLCAGDDATPQQRAAVEALMRRTGDVLWVDDEDRLDRLTAVAGSGPGYVFEIARAYAQAAQDLGFEPSEARRMALDTLAGAVAMARASDAPLAQLRADVTSKAGTTAAGLEALNGDGGLDRLMRSTLKAAYARAVALR